MAFKEAVEQQFPSVAWEPSEVKEGKSVHIGNVVQGWFVEKKEEVGPNRSNIYKLKVRKQDGTYGFLGVWGTTVLDPKMDLVPLGAEVRITYLGKKPTRTGAGKPYANFTVEFDESSKAPMTPVAGAEGNAAAQGAPANQPAAPSAPSTEGY